jgi:hypothetical protein
MTVLYLTSSSTLSSTSSSSSCINDCSLLWNCNCLHISHNCHSLVRVKEGKKATNVHSLTIRVKFEHLDVHCTQFTSVRATCVSRDCHPNQGTLAQIQQKFKIPVSLPQPTGGLLPRVFLNFFEMSETC